MMKPYKKAVSYPEVQRVQIKKKKGQTRAPYSFGSVAGLSQPQPIEPTEPNPPRAYPRVTTPAPTTSTVQAVWSATSPDHGAMGPGLGPGAAHAADGRGARCGGRGDERQKLSEGYYYYLCGGPEPPLAARRKLDYAASWWVASGPVTNSRVRISDGEFWLCKKKKGVFPEAKAAVKHTPNRTACVDTKDNGAKLTAPGMKWLGSTIPSTSLAAVSIRLLFKTPIGVPLPPQTRQNPPGETP